MEPRELGPGEQPMEDVTHFVEECDHVIVPHNSRLVSGRLGKVCDHCSDGVATRAVMVEATGDNRPHRCVRVLALCWGTC